MRDIETENLNGSKEIIDFAACIGEKLNLEDSARGRKSENANVLIQKSEG